MNPMRPAGSFTITYPPISKNNLIVWFTKKHILFNGFSNSNIGALSIPHLGRAMTAIQFSLFVHSIVTAQTRLECFGAFIMYMSTDSNVNMTFDCIQFVSHKASFTFVSIFMAGLYIYHIYTNLMCTFFNQISPSKSRCALDSSTNLNPLFPSYIQIYNFLHNNV